MSLHEIIPGTLFAATGLAARGCAACFLDSRWPSGFPADQRLCPARRRGMDGDRHWASRAPSADRSRARADDRRHHAPAHDEHPARAGLHGEYRRPGAPLRHHGSALCRRAQPGRNDRRARKRRGRGAHRGDVRGARHPHRGRPACGCWPPAHRTAARAGCACWRPTGSSNGATRTLFTSDSFGFLTRATPDAPLVRAPDEPPIAAADIARMLSAKFDWLVGIDPAPILADLDAIFAARAVHRICPGFGCVIEGADAVAEALARMKDAIALLAAQSKPAIHLPAFVKETT